MRPELVNAVSTSPPGLEMRLGKELATAVGAELDEWERDDRVARLWAGDSSLWTGGEESRWLGWLHAPERALENLDRIEARAREAREAGLEHALLLGMGGSSLAPEMFSKALPGTDEVRLRVLDSTDPDQVRAAEATLSLDSTLLIVSSKSGSTLESNVLLRHFLTRLEEAVGSDEAPRRCAAITDPGSSLDELARQRGFRWVAYGEPSIGGRFSALSVFGLVPAALHGVDVARLLRPTVDMMRACGAEGRPQENPAAVLGAAIALAARSGRDKLTLVVPPEVEDLGAWLEQLVAESTGKRGQGIVPVAREPLAASAAYGDDRLVVSFSLEGEPGEGEALATLAAAGHPVVHIALGDPLQLGAELYRWEFATAVAGSILGIDPFDQPDVEASKQATRELTSEYERSGALPQSEPLIREGGIELYADARNRAELEGARTIGDAVVAHLGRARAGDYVALLAYLPRTAEHELALRDIRLLIRDRTRCATVDGFGPRFLHSTGQLFKGGPDTGVFVQLTADPGDDLAVPGARYTFGVVEAAQALGDLSVLEERGRRVIRLHMRDAGEGLEWLRGVIEKRLPEAAGPPA